MTREIINLPLDAVHPNPQQPRKIFDPTALSELAASIKEYGVLQPITVRLNNSCRYELIAGERRLRASRLAGLGFIPAILTDVTDLDSGVLAIIENLQRQDLHFFEEAEGFRKLMMEHAFTQEMLAAKVGKNQSTIANKLRLLKLPRAIKEAVFENELTERHARALLKVEDSTVQADILKKIIDGGLNVRKSEELIEATLSGGKATARAAKFNPVIRDIRLLKNSIMENLDIVRRSGMETQFDMHETDDGYKINITLRHAKQNAKQHNAIKRNLKIVSA